MDQAVQVQKVACAGCGAAIAVPPDIERLNCSYCGSQLIIRRGEGYIASRIAEQVRTEIREVGERLGAKLDAVQNALGAEGTAVKCEKCGRSDSVSTLRAVVQNGTTTTLVNGVQQKSQNEVARALTLTIPPFVAKPLSPAKFYKQSGLILLAVIIGAVIFPGDIQIVVGFLTMLAMVAWGYFFLRHLKEGAAYKARQQAEYAQAVSTRQELYDAHWYCSRCHQIFMPGAGTTFDVEDLELILDTWT